MRIALTLPGKETEFLKKDDTYSVYSAIASSLSSDISKMSEQQHMIAADAEGWAELASVGDHYETREYPGLELDIVD